VQVNEDPTNERGHYVPAEDSHLRGG